MPVAGAKISAVYTAGPAAVESRKQQAGDLHRTTPVLLFEASFGVQPSLETGARSVFAAAAHPSPAAMVRPSPLGRTGLYSATRELNIAAKTGDSTAQVRTPL